MFDCCKYIFKLVMNDWSIVLFDLDTCIGTISSHLFLCQKALQTSILKKKKKKSWKGLALKTSLTRKRWSNLYSKCMMPKPKAYYSKKYEKFHGIIAKKNWVVLIKKFEKWKSNEKLSIKCKHFDGESYMFIFTSEIGHLTSC